MEPKIFFSHSFRKKDNRSTEFFRTLLFEIFGSKNILTGEKPTTPDLYKKTLRKIDDSDAVFVVFPKRDKIGNGNWATSPDVIFETGYAIGQGRRVFGFKEKGVDKDKIGMARFASLKNSDSSLVFPDFNATSLDTLKSQENDFREFIKNIKEEIEEKMEMPYLCLNATKEVIVCHKGYGKIRNFYRHLIKIPKKKLLFEHFFNLEKSAKKGSKLQSFKEMKSRNPHEAYRNNDYFFSSQIIKGEVSSFKPVNTTLEESSTKLHFFFEICGPFKKNQVIEYEFAVGGPNLFPVSSSELQKGKRMKDSSYVESDFGLAFTKIENLAFIVKFEKEKEVDILSKEPTFEFFYPEGKTAEIDEKPKLFDEKRKGAFYTTYQRKKSSVTLPREWLKAVWKPK